MSKKESGGFKLLVVVLMIGVWVMTRLSNLREDL